MSVSPLAYNELLERKVHLENSIQMQTEELKRVNKILAAFNGQGRVNNWTEASVECIKDFNRLVQTNEVLNCLIKRSKVKIADAEKRNRLVALSVALHNLCNNGILKKIIYRGVKGHFYGLSQWFKEDSMPKQPYQNELAKRLARVKSVNDWPVLG